MISTRLFETIPDSGDLQSTGILVVTEQEQQAAQGLVAAAARLGCITEDGREHTVAELFSGVHDDLHYASWVGPVWRSARGPALAMDCKGVVPEAMAQAMTRVLVEELERAGVDDARVLSWPPGFDPGTSEWFPGEWDRRYP